MAQSRKLICNCGKELVEQEIPIDGVMTKAMVCPKDSFTTLTKDQAKEFRKRIEMHHAVDKERQIIKIGNSMGITLPEKLKNFGINVGKKVKIEAIDEYSFKVELVSK